MRSLSASDLLTVWERGIDAGPTRRALELLSAACVGVDWETLATLSIGQRDELLDCLRQLFQFYRLVELDAALKGDFTRCAGGDISG